MVLINTLDKNEIITYNNRTSENRGKGMNKNFRTLLIWWMVLAICWLFLRIGTDIHKTRRINEAIEERASTKSREKERGF